PGGILVVEPWLAPADWLDRHVGAVFVDEPELKIARMNIAQREGNVSIVEFEYLVGTPDGIERFSERHELGLFTVEQYLEAFRAAGSVLPMPIILDWDGTVTVDDTLILALREFGDWQIYLDAAAALRRGDITLHEEIRRDAESIKTPIDDVVAWLVEHLELRPGFHELAEAQRPL